MTVVLVARRDSKTGRPRGNACFEMAIFAGLIATRRTHTHGRTRAGRARARAC
eukprot:COSAG02_NODE_38478_length_428_cov_1.249240_1_plen_52_part_10